MQEEEDVDTKTIMRNFLLSQSRLKRAEKDLEELEEKYARDTGKAKERYDETFGKLVKLQESVVKPMIEEMLEMRKETTHYKTLYFQNFKDLQKLSAIIRLPRMCY